jgi:hypothetical protein
MSRKLRIPPPPLTYSADYERIRNREIEMIMNEKVGATDLTAYGGVPFTAMTGSNAAFVIPVGSTPVKLPFDVLVKDTDPDVVFDPATYSITNPFLMDAIFFVNLRHASAPGGSYDFTMQAFINDVGQQPFTQTIANSETQDIRVARFVVNYAANLKLDLRAWHNRNGDVTFDMTKSAWDVMRMSAAPRIQ